jgi:hypothetical protein
MMKKGVIKMALDPKMLEKVEQVLEKMRDDYRGYSKKTGDEVRDRIRDEMTEQYCNGLSFEDGRAYIRLVSDNGTQRTVCGFILKKVSPAVIRGGKNFRVGDLLKSAGWNAPAMNFPRGNVFDDSFATKTIRWTGIQ